MGVTNIPKRITINNDNIDQAAVKSSSSRSKSSSVQYYARIFITARRNQRSRFSRTTGNLSSSSSVTSAATAATDVREGMKKIYCLVYI